jgi:CPA2 family monovalent cation:H+ antiporter-2
MGPVIASIHAKRDALRDLIVAEGELGFRPKLRATTAYESEQ